MQRTWVMSALIGALWATSAVARAELVVITGAQSDIGEVNMQQVKDLYLGKMTQTAKGVTVIPLDNSEKTEAVFYGKVAKKSLKKMRHLWSHAIAHDLWQPPKQLLSDKEMIEVVSKNPNTLGYVDKASVDSSVKVVLSLP